MPTLFLTIFLASIPAVIPKDTCLDCICIAQNYSKREMPPRPAGRPLVIHAGFNLLDVYNFDVVERTVTATVRHHLTWSDQRIYASNEECTEQILSASIFDMIWVPDLDVDHFRSFNVKSILKEQRFLRITRQLPTKQLKQWQKELLNHQGIPQQEQLLPDGQKDQQTQEEQKGEQLTEDQKEQLPELGQSVIIDYCFSAAVTISCSMDLDRYPFADTTCKYKLISYKLDSSFILFQPNPEFNLTGQLNFQETLVLEVSDLQETDTRKSSLEFHTMDHSVVGFQFIIKSTIYQTILINYFPTILMVAIAICSFMLPISLLPSRISAIMTPLLALLNFLGIITAKAPKGRGNTAVGIWVVFCILFGFICFVCQMIIMKFKNQKGIRGQINLAFLVFMVSFFLLFNIFYWSTYLSAI